MDEPTTTIGSMEWVAQAAGLLPVTGLDPLDTSTVDKLDSKNEEIKELLKLNSQLRSHIFWLSAQVQCIKDHYAFAQTSNYLPDLEHYADYRHFRNRIELTKPKN